MNPLDPRTGRVPPSWAASSFPRTEPATGLGPEPAPTPPRPFGMPGGGPASQGIGTRAPRQPLHAVLSQAAMPPAEISQAMVSRAAMCAAAPRLSAAQVPPLVRAPRLPSLDESCEAALADVWRLIDGGYCRLLASKRLPDETKAREIGVASPDYLAAVAGHEGDLAIEDGESAYEYQVLVIEREGQVASITVHPSFEPAFVVCYEPASGVSGGTRPASQAWHDAAPPGSMRAGASEFGAPTEIRQIQAAVPAMNLDKEAHFKAMLRARVLLGPGERWRQHDMQEAAGLSRTRARALRSQVLDEHARDAKEFLAGLQPSAADDSPEQRYFLLCTESRRRGLAGWDDEAMAEVSGATKQDRARVRRRTARATPDTQAVAEFVASTAAANVGESAADRARRVLDENDRQQGAWKAISMWRGAQVTRGVLEYAQFKRTEAREQDS